MGTDRPRNHDRRADFGDTQEAIPATGIADTDLFVPAVAVTVVGPVATTTDAIQQAAYATFLIPPNSAAKLLNEDVLRQYAYIYPYDFPLVIALNQATAQAAANVGQPASGTAAGTPPSGAIIPIGWTPAIRHNSEVWAFNFNATNAARVTVLVERSNAPGL